MKKTSSPRKKKSALKNRPVWHYIPVNSLPFQNLQGLLNLELATLDLEQGLVYTSSPLAIKEEDLCSLPLAKKAIGLKSILWIDSKI